MPFDNGIPEIPTDCWLARAFNYVRVRSQLPDNAIFWTLVAHCGAALQDSMYVNWAVKPIFPNLPLLIVGESGLGKTGAKNAIEPLFDRCMPPCKAAEDSTAEALTRDLAIYGRTRFGNTAGLWIIPELADVLGGKDYQQGGVARLTRLFDAPLNREVSRAGQQGRVMIQGRCVLSWIAGTTFQWLYKHVDEAVSAGGFLPRLLVIHSQEPLKFIPNPTRDIAEERALNSELIQLLNSNIQQEVVQLPPEWDEVARRIFDERNAKRNTPYAPFIARRSENILRISMIFGRFASASSARIPHLSALAEECAKWFEEQGVSIATGLSVRESALIVTRVSQYLRGLRELVDSTGDIGRKNADVRIVDSKGVRASVDSSTVISYAELCKNLHISSSELKDALKELQAIGDIKWDGHSGRAGKIEWVGGL